MCLILDIFFKTTWWRKSISFFYQLGWCRKIFTVQSCALGWKSQDNVLWHNFVCHDSGASYQGQRYKRYTKDVFIYCLSLFLVGGEDCKAANAIAAMELISHRFLNFFLFFKMNDVTTVTTIHFLTTVNTINYVIITWREFSFVNLS